MTTTFGKTVAQQTPTDTVNSTDILFIGQLGSDGQYTGFRATQQNFTKNRVVSKTANYTITAEDDLVICDATAGAMTVTLPTASGIAGVTKTIKKIDAVANVVIEGYSTETIDGALNQTLTTQWDYMTVISNGTNWLIISSS